MALSHLCRYRQGNERGIQPEVVNLATNGVSSLAFAPGKALTLKEQGYQTKFDYQGDKVLKRSRAVAQNTSPRFMQGINQVYAGHKPGLLSW